MQIPLWPVALIPAVRGENQLSCFKGTKNMAQPKRDNCIKVVSRWKLYWAGKCCCIPLAFKIRKPLNLVKHFMIKISERSFTERFDDSMSSFSSEEGIKLVTKYISCEVIRDKTWRCKSVHVNGDNVYSWIRIGHA